MAESQPPPSLNPSLGSSIPSRWYLPTLPTLPPVALEFFKKYTNLPEDEILPHIIAVREKAWKIFPYPCIGLFYFLDFSISESPSFTRIVSHLESGDTLLDLGCCFGQDIRMLVANGAPSANIYGADLRPEFIDLGYDLFLDRDTLQTQFLAPVDIFDDSEASPLKQLEGTIDIIHIAAFLHLFSHADQVRAAKRISRVLSTKPGSMVVGRQMGSIKPGEYVHRTNSKTVMFRHDLETFEKFWNEDVGGGRWEVEATFRVVEPRGIGGESREPVFDGETRWLEFSVRRAS